MVNIAKITNDKLKRIKIAIQKKFLLDRREEQELNKKTNIASAYTNKHIDYDFFWTTKE